MIKISFPSGDEYELTLDRAAQIYADAQPRDTHLWTARYKLAIEDPEFLCMWISLKIFEDLQPCLTHVTYSSRNMMDAGVTYNP